MVERTQIQLEYAVKCSPKVLFNRLNTAPGLSEWFADDVTEEGAMFTFVWGKTSHRAEKKLFRENKLVRYEWADVEEDNHGVYFEFTISQHDLTNDVSLTITDFPVVGEVDEAIHLWDTQIRKLKHLLGS